MTLQAILVTALAVFTVGLTGAIVGARLSRVLISLWLMFLSAAICSVAFARWNLLPDGKVIAILVLCSGTIVVASGFVFRIFQIENKSGDAQAEQGTSANKENV
jgi:NADH:ubiquinone oxidoreductase subunit K